MYVCYKNIREGRFRNIINCYFLYSSINNYYCFGNKSSRSLKTSKLYLISIFEIFFELLRASFFFAIFYYFRLNNLLPRGCIDKKTKTKKHKKIHDCLSACIKTAWFAVSLIVLQNVKVFGGLKIHS